MIRNDKKLASGISDVLDYLTNLNHPSHLFTELSNDGLDASAIEAAGELGLVTIDGEDVELTVSGLWTVHGCSGDCPECEEIAAEYQLL